MAVENCGTCRFAEHTEQITPWGRTFTCRRYPPTQVVIGGQVRQVCPVSIEVAWCGEYQVGEPHIGRGDMWGAKIADDKVTKLEPFQ